MWIISTMLQFLATSSLNWPQLKEMWQYFIFPWVLCKDFYEVP